MSSLKSTTTSFNLSQTRLPAPEAQLMAGRAPRAAENLIRQDQQDFFDAQLKDSLSAPKTGPPNVFTLGDMETRLTKNRLDYFLLDGSPYSCKRSFVSAYVCVCLWFKTLRVSSVVSVGSSDPEHGRGGAGEKKLLDLAWDHLPRI